MKIYVICDSKTGNTRMLEEVIRQRYAGNITENLQEADVVFMGSWTDKGNCSEKVSNYFSLVPAVLAEARIIMSSCSGGQPLCWMTAMRSSVISTVRARCPWA